ncbi:MAG: protein translocase subunit SecF, partial [Planctomycetes bacterium]|nr:protein translocase subunit SecF [Planctomycetota bacterium]
GMILTLGMAVAANVLINERMREELNRGVSVKLAMKLGYEKAFSAILDGNVTTVIVAVILAYLGSEEIKGFGQTLGIGLCVSMFTALFVTRQYLNVMVPTSLDRKETTRCWIGTAVLALVGGGFFGLGWLVHRGNAIMREESALLGVGRFLLIVFATALGLLVTMWLFRSAYRVFGHQRANRMPMLKFLTTPNVDWMRKYRIFWTISCVVVLGGMVFAWQQLKFDPNAVLDIEFIGGTSVQVGLKPEYQAMTDEQIGERIAGRGAADPSSSVGWLRHMADVIADAKVTKLADLEYNITPSEPLTTPQMEALLSTGLGSYIARGGVTPGDTGVNVQFDSERTGSDLPDAAAVQAELKACGTYMTQTADKLRSPKVQLVEEQTSEGTRRAFEIVVTESNKQLVAEALLASMRDYLEVTQPIEAKLVQDPTRAADGLFPIKQGDRTVADVLGPEIGGIAGGNSVETHKGGVLLVFSNVQPPATEADINDRLKQMQLQPDLEAVARDRDVIGLESEPAAAGGAPRFKRFAIAVSDPLYPYVEDSQNADWRTNLADKELKLAQAALASSRALQRVTQFAQQVAGEAAIKAIIAIVISLIAIAIYVWARFGSADFGVAGIIALYHDVAVTLSCIIAAHALHDTPLGRLLGLHDFRVDLALVAALLTLVGFSINDTIVIFDRIRENRGRLATISPALVNRSVNETLSRTIITSLTVFLTVLVMYIWGGEGIHGFAFAMMIGVLTGSYSTVAIAPPLMMRPRILWTTAIILAGLTLIGLASLIGRRVISYPLMTVLALLAVYGLYQVALRYRGERNVIMTAPATSAAAAQ